MKDGGVVMDSEEELVVKAILEGLSARGLVLEEFPGGKLALTPLYVGRALLPCARKVALKELKELLKTRGLEVVTKGCGQVEIIERK